MGHPPLRLVRPPQLDLATARAAAHSLAAGQSGIASRRQLRALGVSRWAIRHELQVGRWQRTGRQSIAVHNGPLSRPAKRWVAVLEVGRRAALDGVAALQAAGCDALTNEVIDVIVPKGSTPQHPPGEPAADPRPPPGAHHRYVCPVHARVHHRGADVEPKGRRPDRRCRGGAPRR